MKAFGWALSPLKLQRAIAQAGVGATEAEIKAKYELMGGAVDTTYPETTNEDVVEAPIKAPKAKKTKPKK